MQMEKWQDAAAEQVKLLAEHLTEMLSKALKLLHSELGVDLGIKPEAIPPWVLLSALGAGLLLMLALWASLCWSLFKKRQLGSGADDPVDEKLGVVKPVRSEEPKKKKKKAEKKSQSNGRAVTEPQEEAIPPEEIVPHHQSPPSEAKTDKNAEGKKSKKKAKQAAKPTKPETSEAKEPEEGTWETKVSNKEKREQRKKDKSDGSASPSGGDTPVNSSPEQPKAAVVPAPANQKKKKKEPVKAKADKVEAEAAAAVVSAVAPALKTQVYSSQATPVVNSVTEAPVKAPVHSSPPKKVSWTASREAASLWSGDIDESWTVIDAAVPTIEPHAVSLAGLKAEPVRDLPWLSQPKVDDEWSGLNGGSADPSSDWSAPAEVWGNYEEPTAEPPLTPSKSLPETAKVNLLIAAALDDEDDEKDKGESADGVAKSKKKKKKKKKSSEEGAGQGDEPEKELPPPVTTKKQPPAHVTAPAAAVQTVKAAAVEARKEQPVKEKVSQKASVTQVPQKPGEGEAAAKQNSPAAPTQQKIPEESQALKPAKKKKARRET